MHDQLRRLVMLCAAVAWFACSPGTPISGTINVASYVSGTPFEFYQPHSNVPVGLDIELLAAIAAKLGMAIPVTNHQFDDLLNAVAHGKFDAAMSAISDTSTRAICTTYLLDAIEGDCWVNESTIYAKGLGLAKETRRLSSLRVCHRFSDHLGARQSVRHLMGCDERAVVTAGFHGAHCQTPADLDQPRGADDIAVRPRNVIGGEVDGQGMLASLDDGNNRYPNGNICYYRRTAAVKNAARPL
ncbi:MAG TPA: transporter substrate-binding domain-containing protein [Candidatus Binatia bacterium]|nr:transporter substrate-binding domain-containing protein [Candidatus Binatia bacterium]